MVIDLTASFAKGADYLLAVKIVERLWQAGHKAYFAGGCVRDALLGRRFNDIDIVTSATPDQIEELFIGQTIPVGKKFGIIVVHENRQQIEVATFRKDGAYVDGRRPEEVIFSNEQEDALRRDFTVNALFYDLKEKKVIDYVQGLEDLKNQLIKTVGSPEKRFAEDYLRILRMHRFALSLGFSIETKTLEAAQNLVLSVEQISMERRQEELFKVFFSGQDQLKIYRYYQSHRLFTLFFSTDLEPVPDVLWADLVSDEVSLLSILLWNADSYVLILKKFKLSVKITKSVLKILGYKKEHLSILASTEGEKRYECLTPEFALFLELQERLTPLAEIKRLKTLCKQYLDNPPVPLLTGEDLKAYFQGKELGNALELVFKEQLVQNWSNKDNALRWMLKKED